MQTKTEIIEKLKKILALANDKGAPQGEVEAALAKAKEIAMRHAIDLAGIDLNGKDEGAPGMETDRADIAFRSKKPQKYHRWILLVLNHVFGIETVTTWSGPLGQHYVFIGEPTDVAISQLLFPWLEDVFYKTYTQAKKLGLAVPNAASKNAVYIGLARGIIEANERAEAALSPDDKSKWALVVVNKEALVQKRMHEEFPNLRTAKAARPLSINGQALQYGRDEGRKINLRQTGAGASTKQLQ